MACTSGAEIKRLDLNGDLKISNTRQMALPNVLTDVGVKIEAGKKTELFWVIISIIVSGVLIAVSIWGGKKKRRR